MGRMNKKIKKRLKFICAHLAYFHLRLTGKLSSKKVLREVHEVQ